MSSILESVEWGKNPLNLLDQIKQLEPIKPIFMHIRHSERPLIDLQKSDNLDAPLSVRGEKASYEFGYKLPTDRKYILYHTDMDRTVKTVEKIKQAIQDNSGSATIKGEIKLASVIDVKAVVEILRKFSGLSEEERSQIWIHRWIAGMYPPWVMKTSLEFSQIAASIMMNNIKANPDSDVHIWVTHDNWLMATLHHWFGENNFGSVGFMDGFIVQLNEEYMTEIFRDQKKQAAYPYWWPKS